MSDAKVITIQVDEEGEEQLSPTSAPVQETKSRYPWAHLFEEEEDSAAPPAELIDYAEAHRLNAELSVQKDELAGKNAALTELKTISSQAFDEMKLQIAQLQGEVAQKDDEIAELQELARKAETDRISPLQSAIITQSIIAHSKKLSADSAARKIYEGLLRWLQQRQKVVQYLTEKELRPDLKAKLENILFIDKDEIENQISQLKLVA